jgi:hypothetical protein
MTPNRVLGRGKIASRMERSGAMATGALVGDRLELFMVQWHQIRLLDRFWLQSMLDTVRWLVVAGTISKRVAVTLTIRGNCGGC